MSNLFFDESIEDITIQELAKRIECTNLKIRVDAVVVCDNGILVTGTNADLWGAKIKHWIPEQRAAYLSLSNWLESFYNRKDSFAPIPSLYFQCSDSKGRNISFVDDNKTKVSFDCRETSNGNILYILG